MPKGSRPRIERPQSNVTLPTKISAANGAVELDEDAYVAERNRAAEAIIDRFGTPESRARITTVENVKRFNPQRW